MVLKLQWIVLLLSFVIISAPKVTYAFSSSHFLCDRLAELILLRAFDQRALKDRSLFGFGKSFTYTPEHPRPIRELRTLRVGSFNLFNFQKRQRAARVIEEVGDFVERIPTLKSYKDRVAMGKAINEMNPDLMAVEEIESLDLLQTFSEDFLRDQYKAVILVGNSNRRVQIGFLIKRDLPLKFEMHGFHEMESIYQGEVKESFSRDLPVIIVRRIDNDRPVMAIAGTHYKSKGWDTPEDPQNVIRRKIQVEETVGIMQMIRSRYGRSLPVILAGDFNNDLPTATEFDPLFRYGFRDSLDLHYKKDDWGRVTHAYCVPKQQTNYAQLDGILYNFPNVPGPILMDADVYHYKNDAGVEKRTPRNIFERNENPSDHFPIYADFNMRKLLGN